MSRIEEKEISASKQTSTAAAAKTHRGQNNL